MIKRNVLIGGLLGLLLCSSVAYALLPPVIALAGEFVGGLLLRTAARQTIMAVGVAANDSSWVQAMTLAARAIQILKIAAGQIEYEIPVEVGVPVPAPVVAPSGDVGTYANPMTAFETTLRLKPTAGYGSFCNVQSNYSTDGAAHLIEVKWYTLAELVAACNATKVFWNAASGLAGGQWVAVDQTDSTTTYTVNTSTATYRLRRWGLYDATNDKEDQGSKFAYMLAESPDSVKRFIRTAEGFLPDEADPDWTAQEKAAFNTAKALQFQNQNSLVRVTGSNTQTRIEAATQAGTDVKYRVLELAPTAQPTAVTEKTLAGAVASDVIASGQSGTGTGEIVFPTDYARQGEAAAATVATVARLDTLHDDLTKASTAAGDPVVPDAGGGFEGAFFNGTFTDLLGWRLPGHAGVCPTADIAFTFFGQPFDLHMNAQCALLNDPDVYNVASTAFTVLWLVCALFIVLKA
ncbi:hypothetical protein [Propionivibrio soli]|uniref:hypothetical protein n=1 Tax=Propionivibrio soli TaxID=2976531 RepID=UPI0021E7B2EE|nr:hypothetical protein [Propionivibrio soli]